MSDHIVSAFTEELESLSADILRMGGIVEEMIVDSCQAVLHNNLDLAADVIDRDPEVDRMEAEVERQIVSLIARRQPGKHFHPTGRTYAQLDLPALGQAIAAHLAESGLTVGWNHPYSGGHITRHHGDARSTRQALQIEINRNLYMDGDLRLNIDNSKSLVETIGRLGRFLATLLSASSAQTR